MKRALVVISAEQGPGSTWHFNVANVFGILTEIFKQAYSHVSTIPLINSLHQ